MAHIPGNVLQDVWLQWHVHVHRTHNVAQLRFDDLEHASDESGLSCTPLERVANTVA